MTSRHLGHSRLRAFLGLALPALLVLSVHGWLFAQAKPAVKPLGIGRAATPDEIRKLDIDVMPDGR